MLNVRGPAIPALCRTSGHLYFGGTGHLHFGPTPRRPSSGVTSTFPPIVVPTGLRPEAVHGFDSLALLCSNKGLDSWHATVPSCVPILEALRALERENGGRHVEIPEQQGAPGTQRRRSA